MEAGDGKEVGLISMLDKYKRQEKRRTKRRQRGERKRGRADNGNGERKLKGSG